MSTGTATAPTVTLPAGFDEWAKKYFDQVKPDGAVTDAKPSAYLRMKERVSPQLESAKKKSPELAQEISSGLTACDLLSNSKDDANAVKGLRALVTSVETKLADERTKLEARMVTLYDKATEIRLELNPDADAVRSTVRTLTKNWDFATATTTMNTFEKAIEKAKPIDFENLDVIQKRRGKEFRKENAKFARNTEQALMAAKRIVDAEGNLILEEGPLKGLPFVRTDDLASIAEQLEASQDTSLPNSVHALEMLKRLQTDKEAQAALKTVKAPPDPNDASKNYTEDQKQSLRAAQSLIRNTLGLADDAAITDAEAKRAAVAALLAQLRQVDVGSCFATAQAVRVQRNKPEQFLADMAEMLSTGKLKREIESPPGTKVIIEGQLSRDMVGRKVDVARQNPNLHLNPKMIAGLDAMGIAEGDQKGAIEAAARKLRAERAFAKALGKVASFLPKGNTVDSLSKKAMEKIEANPGMSIETALSQTLSPHKLSTASTSRSNARKKTATDACKDFDDSTGSDDFTPQQLLERIGKDRPGGALSAEKVAASKAAFDTSHDNTLLRAWEYTIATMVEKHPGHTSNGSVMSKGIGTAVESLLTAAIKKRCNDKGMSQDETDVRRTLDGATRLPRHRSRTSSPRGSKRATIRASAAFRRRRRPTAPPPAGATVCSSEARKSMARPSLRRP